MRKKPRQRMTMKFINLNLYDYDRIVELWKKTELPYKPRGRDSRTAVATEMKANPDFFLGAFDGNRLVGVVVLSSDLRRGWINRLAVEPNYRRRGVARKLITRSEEILRQHGLGLFAVLVDDCNETSKALFQKCGYVEHRDVIYFTKRETEDI